MAGQGVLFNDIVGMCREQDAGLSQERLLSRLNSPDQAKVRAILRRTPLADIAGVHPAETYNGKDFAVRETDRTTSWATA
jgi:hypothetical protein